MQASRDFKQLDNVARDAAWKPNLKPWDFRVITDQQVEDAIRLLKDHSVVNMGDTSTEVRYSKEALTIQQVAELEVMKDGTKEIKVDKHFAMPPDTPVRPDSAVTKLMERTPVDEKHAISDYNPNDLILNSQHPFRTTIPHAGPTDSINSTTGTREPFVRVAGPITDAAYRCIDQIIQRYMGTMTDLAYQIIKIKAIYTADLTEYNQQVMLIYQKVLVYLIGLIDEVNEEHITLFAKGEKINAAFKLHIAELKAAGESISLSAIHLDLAKDELKHVNGLMPRAIILVHQLLKAKSKAWRAHVLDIELLALVSEREVAAYAPKSLAISIIDTDSTVQIITPIVDPTIPISLQMLDKDEQFVIVVDSSANRHPLTPEERTQYILTPDTRDALAARYHHNIAYRRRQNIDLRDSTIKDMHIALTNEMNAYSTIGTTSGEVIFELLDRTAMTKSSITQLNTQNTGPIRIIRDKMNGYQYHLKYDAPTDTCVVTAKYPQAPSIVMQVAKYPYSMDINVEIGAKDGEIHVLVLSAQKFGGFFFKDPGAEEMLSIIRSKIQFALHGMELFPRCQPDGVIVQTGEGVRYYKPQREIDVFYDGLKGDYSVSKIIITKAEDGTVNREAIENKWATKIFKRHIRNKDAKYLEDHRMKSLQREMREMARLDIYDDESLKRQFPALAGLNMSRIQDPDTECYNVSRRYPNIPLDHRIIANLQVDIETGYMDREKESMEVVLQECLRQTHFIVTSDDNGTEYDAAVFE